MTQQLVILERNEVREQNLIHNVILRLPALGGQSGESPAFPLPHKWGRLNIKAPLLAGELAAKPPEGWRM